MKYQQINSEIERVLQKARKHWNAEVKKFCDETGLDFYAEMGIYGITDGKKTYTTNDSYIYHGAAQGSETIKTPAKVAKFLKRLQELSDNIPYTDVFAASLESYTPKPAKTNG